MLDRLDIFKVSQNVSLCYTTMKIYIFRIMSVSTGVVGAIFGFVNRSPGPYIHNASSHDVIR